MDTEHGDKLLSLAQAAAHLGISPVTLRAQAKKGILRATLLGHTYIVALSEVERYAREHRGRVGPRPKRQQPG